MTDLHTNHITTTKLRLKYILLLLLLVIVRYTSVYTNERKLQHN